MAERLQVSWDVQAQKKRTARLHYRLFGRRTKKDGRPYYYDGILAGWKNGRRVKLVEYERFGPTNISVPADLADQILKLFKELRIDHRLISYNSRNNLFSKTYSASTTSIFDRDTQNKVPF